MTELMILMGIILILCVLMQRLTAKLPIPSLLAFLFLGMLFGVNGIFRIQFDNYEISELICSICLVFIMFYGGFGTSFKAAKPVLKKSVALASVGVVLTALFTGCFVYTFLKLPWLESLLIGSVIASTDAASVFSILRSQKLNLKENTASLLEVESGSNDPVSYMLTIVLCTLLKGSSVSIFKLLFLQVSVGLFFGLIFGKIAAYLMKHGQISKEEGKTVFVFAVILLSYAIPAIFQGNGYLSVYLCGMILGNEKIPGKRSLIHFFDTFTQMAQIMIFFLLGLLVTPKELPNVFIPALLIMIFMTFVSRPLSVFFTLLPFKTTKGQGLIVSWAGLRGAASIVFAITAVLSGIELEYNLFNLVFCIVLISISIQGSLLPYISKKLNMIDNTLDVYKTFNDYQEENEVSFIKIHISKDHPWIGLPLKTAPIPKEFLVTLVLRKEGNFIPNGNTVIEKGDLLVMAAETFTDQESLYMQEIYIDQGHKWVNHSLASIHLEKGVLIMMIQRGDKSIIPDGKTVIQNEDLLITVRYE